MILGSSRVPFQRPAAASGSFVPGLPQTVRNSHFHPFATAMNPMPAASAWMPGLPAQMGPTPLPAVPAVVPAAPAVTPPSAGGMSGAGFGSTGGVRGHMHIDPYMVMRSGYIPGVSPSGSNIRAGVRNAAGRIQRSMPFQTAPLPPPPPPPAPPSAAPAPGPVAGFLGSLFGMPRHRIRHKRSWWHFSPETTPVAETVQTGGCETYGPRADGVKVTVCNGRVTRMEDAQGNVINPNYGPMAGSLGAWRHWGRRFAHHAMPGHNPFRPF